MNGERQVIDFINDILNQIEKSKKFLKGVTYEQFIINDEKLYAVIHCLAIMGEAANKIPKSVQKTYNYIKWKEIITMRNILIHYYYGADEMIIWKTVVNDLPDLEEQILKLRKDLINE